MTSSRRSPQRRGCVSPDLIDPTFRPLEPGAARALLAGPTLAAAGRLIGARLVHEGSDRGPVRIGRIVEVEAYIGTDDQASHARFGLTARNAVMFGPPGLAYVYLVYGMYDCLNVVTEPEGRAAAVLIRALEPVAGTAVMRDAREHARARRGIRPVADERLASGPGLLCAAMSIDRGDTGRDLLDPASPLRLEIPAGGLPAARVGRTPRVGIGYAGEPWRSRPWRFVDLASRAVSGRPAAARV
jgi:DNA-3-methyladenine glycosylase